MIKGADLWAFVKPSVTLLMKGDESSVHTTCVDMVLIEDDSKLCMI